MMKTLCVAVFVLSLTSVCQPASLACNKLLKPVDNGPDLSGSWHLIAMASENCWLTTLINNFLLLSIKVDVSPRDTPKIYNINFNMKIYGHCANESSPVFYENNTLYDVNKNYARKGEPHVILQTGCPDCVVINGEYVIMLYSRRTTVTTAELKEFEAQIECLKWAKPQILNSDHEYKNCPSVDDDDVDTSELLLQISNKMKSLYTESVMCFAHNFIYYPRAVYEWAQQLWTT